MSTRKNPAAVALGRRGGRSTSAAKIAASRASIAVVNARKRERAARALLEPVEPCDVTEASRGEDDNGEPLCSVR
jgi:hypothetical protein